MTIPFIQARNYTKTNGRGIGLIVVHDMEHPEIPGAARSVAKWFAGKNAPQASAHYCIDNLEVIQCVRDQDIAWHAPGANHNGIGLEHTGYAHQTAADWSDPYSAAMLQLSADLVREKCARYSIPIRFVNAEGLKAGAQGITTHAEVSRAWHRTNHTDPGVNFPMEHYLDLIRAETPTAAAGSGPPTVTRTDYPEGEDMLTRHDIDIPALDGQGRGWVELDVPAAAVVSLVVNGPYPPVDGYWELPIVARQARGDKTVVTLSEGQPNSHVVLAVWALS